MKQHVLKSLATTYYLVTNKSPDGPLKAALVDELDKYPENHVLHALNRCKNECKGFLPLAEIIERMPSCRLSANEAWAAIPKTESDSCFWSDEMREAYGAAHTLLLEGDTIAARMAFIEAYKRICGNKANTEPKYSFSAGTDVNHRVSVLKEACDRGLIKKARALQLLPVDKCSDRQLSYFEPQGGRLLEGGMKVDFGSLAKKLPWEDDK